MNTKRKFIKKTISVALTMIFLLNLGISFQSVEGSYLPSVSLSTMGVQGQAENENPDQSYGSGDCTSNYCSNLDHYDYGGWGNDDDTGQDYDWHESNTYDQNGNPVNSYTRHYRDSDGNQTTGYTITTTTYPDGRTRVQRRDWH